MVDAKKIRVGNWLKYLDNEMLKPELKGVDFKITADNILAFEEGVEVSEFIGSIPLNEDNIINLLGFLQIEESKYLITKYILKKEESGKYSMGILNVNDGMFETTYFAWNITTVDRVQNLLIDLNE